MATPYTPADVEMVAAALIAEAKKNPVDTSRPTFGMQMRPLLGPTEHDIARAVLDALTAAGWHPRPLDADGNRPDDCGHCTLVPTVNGWVRGAQTPCPIHGDPARRTAGLEHNVAAFRAARDWAAEHVHPQPDDRMLKAYGQALLASLDIDPRHIIDFRDDGWTIQHPLTCRPNLFACPVNRAAGQQVTAEPATGLGRYACWLHEDDGLLVLGDRVDQAEG